MQHTTSTERQSCPSLACPTCRPLTSWRGWLAHPLRRTALANQKTRTHPGQRGRQAQGMSPAPHDRPRLGRPARQLLQYERTSGGVDLTRRAGSRPHPAMLLRPSAFCTVAMLTSSLTMTLSAVCYCTDSCSLWRLGEQVETLPPLVLKRKEQASSLLHLEKTRSKRIE